MLAKPLLPVAIGGVEAGSTNWPNYFLHDDAPAASLTSLSAGWVQNADLFSDPELMALVGAAPGPQDEVSSDSSARANHDQQIAAAAAAAAAAVVGSGAVQQPWTLEVQGAVQFTAQPLSSGAPVSGSGSGSGAPSSTGLVENDGNEGRKRKLNKAERKREQLKQLEATLQAKSAEYERLVSDNENLKLRYNLLERLVSLRTDQLRVIKLGDSQPAGEGDASAAAAAAAAKGPQAAAAAQALESIGLHWSTAQTVPLFEALEPPGDSDRHRNMGVVELTELYKAYLGEASHYLLQLEAHQQQQQQGPGAASSPAAAAAAAAAARQLSLLCANMAYVLRTVGCRAADTLQKLLTTHLETEQEELPPPGHWPTLLRSLELTPQQQRELLSMAQLHQRMMGRVLADRSVIVTRMAAEGGHHLEQDLKRLEAMQIPVECEVMKELMRNMRKEKSLHMLLRGFLFGNCLNLMQFARVTVYSYPHFPDATAIIMTLAQELKVI